ncbi:MAG: hypothetical protein BGO30_03405 [Bacteroidetes bacterium 41-46]|nr:MAG: hypothetical protein BGO30_03405 [Bacteroidetes bacterium 41-46]
MVNISKLIIGSILSEPESASIACELVSSEMFEDIDRLIFAKIEELTEQGSRLDLYVLGTALKKDLAPYGGATYLAETTLNISSASRLKEYCLILKQEHIKKQYFNFFSEGAQLCTNGVEAQRIIDFAQAGADNLMSLSSTSSEGFLHISQLTEKAITKAEERCLAAKEGRAIGVPTGIRALNRLLNGGFKPGTLNILAARPAMGKTAVMLHFAKCAAASGVPVCIYSLEMSDISLTDRMLMSIGNMDVDSYKNGDFTQWPELMEAQGVLNKLPIFIDSKAQVNLSYIHNHSRRMAQKGKCGLILIDYLQLADMSTGEKNRNREQEVAQASRRCKIIAKELNVPVVLLSQLSRSVEDSKNKIPQLSHLRESGAIEQDADIVAFLYRAAYYGVDSIETYDNGTISSAGIGELIIGKNRDGSVGAVLFQHNPSMTIISDYHSQ